MSNTVVRVASIDDRADLEALIDVCYSVIYPGWYDDELLTDALPAMLRIDPNLLESGHYFRVTEGGELAGCGGWSKSPPTGEGNTETGHIRHFATHPDHMRKGVGSAILERCIAEAQTGRIMRLQCFSSLPGEPFYARHGFETVDTVNIMMSESVVFPAILMERALT